MIQRPRALFAHNTRHTVDNTAIRQRGDAGRGTGARRIALQLESRLDDPYWIAENRGDSACENVMRISFKSIENFN